MNKSFYFRSIITGETVNKRSYKWRQLSSSHENVTLNWKTNCNQLIPLRLWKCCLILLLVFTMQWRAIYSSTYVFTNSLEYFTKNMQNVPIHWIQLSIAGHYKHNLELSLFFFCVYFLCFCTRRCIVKPLE